MVFKPPRTDESTLSKWHDAIGERAPCSLPCFHSVAHTSRMYERALKRWACIKSSVEVKYLWKPASSPS